MYIPEDELCVTNLTILELLDKYFTKEKSEYKSIQHYILKEGYNVKIRDIFIERCSCYNNDEELKDYEFIPYYESRNCFPSDDIDDLMQYYTCDTTLLLSNIEISKVIKFGEL